MDTIGIFGWVALWLAMQLPLGILLGSCLRRASGQDLPKSRAETRGPATVMPLRRHQASSKSAEPTFVAIGYLRAIR
jgi:hypothetical protein